MVPIHINSSSIKNRITAANHASEKNQNEVSACGNFLSLKASLRVKCGCVHKTSTFLFSPDIWRDRKKKTKIAKKYGKARYRDDFSHRHFIQCALFSKSSTWVGWLAVATGFFIFEESRFVSAFYRFFTQQPKVMKNIFLSPIAIKPNHHGKSWCLTSYRQPCRT